MRPALLVAVLIAGCGAHVRITAEPENASVVSEDGGALGVPADVTVGPLRTAKVQVVAPGYRALDVRLPWHRFALRRTPEVHVLLVEEHGPAGTWTK